MRPHALSNHMKGVGAVSVIGIVEADRFPLGKRQSCVTSRTGSPIARECNHIDTTTRQRCAVGGQCVIRRFHTAIGAGVVDDHQLVGRLGLLCQRSDGFPNPSGLIEERNNHRMSVVGQPSSVSHICTSAGCSQPRFCWRLMTAWSDPRNTPIP